MPDQPVSLAEARAKKAEDSTLWTPLDAARALVRDLEGGKIKPDRLAIHYMEPDDDGGRTHHFVVANLTYETHLSLLEIAKFRLMDEWRR